LPDAKLLKGVSIDRDPKMFLFS